MKNFVFRTPTGEEVTKYDEAFFADIFLNKGKEFWSMQSGDAGIHIIDENQKGEAVIIFSDRHGFFIQHFFAGEKDEYVISHKDDLSEKITVYPGGEPWNVPVSFFSERQEALEVVKEILKNGTRLGTKKWVKLWDGEWSD